MSDLSVRFLDDAGGGLPMIAIVRGDQIVEAAELSLPTLLMLAGQFMLALAKRGHVSRSALFEVPAMSAKTWMH